MKPVFKCDYCTFMGTKEEVKKHEPDCIKNYDMKSCYTCKHAKCSFGTNINFLQYKCNKEVVELSENQICKFCKAYERKEEKEINFNGLFGGLGF